MTIAKTTFIPCNMPSFNWADTFGFTPHNFESIVLKEDTEKF
jgi:hypothetical protein